jgi:hypothetical protein
MASMRKSPPPRRKRESQRLTLKVRTASHPALGAAIRRRSAPRVESPRPERSKGDLVRDVIEEITADLTKDPRHET